MYDHDLESDKNLKTVENEMIFSHLWLPLDARSPRRRDLGPGGATLALRTLPEQLLADDLPRPLHSAAPPLAHH